MIPATLAREESLASCRILAGWLTKWGLRFAAAQHDLGAHVANFLYRLGRGSFRHRGRVVSIWAVLFIALLAAVGVMGVAPSSSLSIPGTDSQRAIDALKSQFPAAAGAAGTVVVRAPAGQNLMTPENQAVVAGLVQVASAQPGVVAVTNPFEMMSISPDATTALINVQYLSSGDALSSEERAAYEGIGNQAPPGWQVAAGGEPLISVPKVSAAEVIGVVIALVVLIITFGSLVAAGMTMLNALIGVGVGMMGILLVGHAVPLNDVTPILALMLGLAVGIDYSLFISSRYRHNVALGLDRAEAAGRAVGTAGSAVVFAGLTVVIALAGLSVVGIPFLTSMGLAAAGTVAVAVLVAVTLLPALLSFTGDLVLSRKQRKADAGSAHHDDLEDSPENRGFAWARWVVKRRVPVLIIGVLVLGGLAIPAASLQLALPDDGTAAEGTSKREAYDLITENFGPGFNGRLLLVVSGDEPDQVALAAGQAAELTMSSGKVVAVTPPQPNQTGTTMLVGIIPMAGPTDADTVALVDQLRGDLAQFNTGGTTISVTGITALGIDISAKLSQALPVYLLVVVGLSFVLLMLVFRSLLVPLKATLGFLLTVGATIGVTVMIFQWGWARDLVALDTAGPLVSFLPIMMIGILFGLAMDYEVFLVSRMREDFVHGETAAEAIVSGVGHGARVVVAAALIMISVFAGFIFMTDPVIKSMGFALAFGVFIDAFIVRLTLVPAAMSFLGDKAWWLPGWLNKILPNVDIEGESLRRNNDPEQLAAPVHATAV